MGRAIRTSLKSYLSSFQEGPRDQRRRRAVVKDQFPDALTRRPTAHSIEKRAPDN
uniref:Uncharacterized protein n=1 Tax=Utricularia reniformis TaxID=192314 RepID=A0A1Y0B0V9_9LAMI|nr:hypothetical protein AEK19_MT0768 [Utricularia reniformis]ART31011.1 hypothetical protein AEK19_MT0768 [Utricularia reniformis]